jgi:hypothetical protein
MKLKNFQDYLEKRLTTRQIAEIKRQAALEKRALQTLQNDVASAMKRYMREHKIGFNELVKRLEVSPTHVAKIQKGEANLTLASVARLFALLGQQPHLVFDDKN